MVFGRRTLSPLEERLGHRFQRPELLELAVTHRSWANERGIPEHYERLEFLGDAVLGLVTAEWLYAEHPHLPEGELSKLKAQLVSRAQLAREAGGLKLGEALRIGVGEERSGGREKASLLADSLEAVFGALYLDGGYPAARKVIVSMLLSALDPKTTEIRTVDAKTRLQETCQALGWALPDYQVVESSGPDHSKVFVVECLLANGQLARGEGTSKKVAEQRAAAEALAALEEGSIESRPL